MDQRLRLAERDGTINLRLRLQAGLVSLQTIKRLAVCGNKEAQMLLGFRRKPKVHLISVLKVMLKDCPDRVQSVIDRRGRVTLFTKHGNRRRPPNYKWLRQGSLPGGPAYRKYTRSEPHFELARRLVGYGMPGFWWLGREMCKLGRVL